MTADIARSIGRGGTAIKIAVRSGMGIDTNPVPNGWSHVTKVDPEPEKKLPLLYPVYLQHTSAISVGGSRDVNSTNTEETFELLDAVDVPTIHEPSAARHVTNTTRDRSEFLAIPAVLNGDATSIVGTLGEGIEYLREELIPTRIDEKLRWLPEPWKARLSDLVTSWLLESAVFEAYIIQNVDSAAAREAGVTEDELLTPAEAARRGLAAEKYLECPVIYVEYSGTYGGTEAVETVAALREQLSWSRIWYGGGISSREDATAILDAGADTVIVGDVFHSIASEETELVARARDRLDYGTSLSGIAEWLSSEVAIEETSAYKYLATIPDVGQPDRLGREYLSKTISLQFIVSECIERRGSEGADKQGLTSKIQQRWGTHGTGEPVPEGILDALQSHISHHSSGDGGSPSLLSSHTASLDP